MSDNNDPVYDKLGLKQLPKKTIELVPVDKSKGDDLTDDLDEVRANTRSLIEIGELGISELQNLASQSQDPKAYRELSVLIKVMLDANKDLVNITKTRHELAHKDDKYGDAPQNVTNNLYVGTTTDAVEILKQKRANKGEDT